MTHRFPHDFWAGRNLDLESEYRFDSSMPQGLGSGGPYGFSRNLNWDAPSSQEERLQVFIDETALDEIDLDEEPLDDGPFACLVEDLHPKAASTGLYVPEKYEPNYPYPLIVWFHDAGGSESDLLSLMPRISERNYFGLSLRGSISVGQNAQAGFDWSCEKEAVSRLEDHLFHTICELRRNFHIHSERVILAGSGRGATMAIRLLFNRPEWFAGAFALGGDLPLGTDQIPTDPERRVFLAGDVGPSKTLTPECLSQLNQWVMESICAPV
jgi:predicted esterase